MESENNFIIQVHPLSTGEYLCKGGVCLQYNIICKFLSEQNSEAQLLFILLTQAALFSDLWLSLQQLLRCRVFCVLLVYSWRYPAWLCWVLWRTSCTFTPSTTIYQDQSETASSRAICILFAHEGTETKLSSIRYGPILPPSTCPCMYFGFTIGR